MKGPDGKVSCENYPEVMAAMLEQAKPGRFEIANFGKGGTTGWFCSNPWWNETKLDHLARTRAFQPDVIVVMFGVNDCAQWRGEGYVNSFTHPWSEGVAHSFLMARLVNTLPNRPRIVWGTPSWVWGKVAGYRWQTNWPGAEEREEKFMMGHPLSMNEEARALLEKELGTPVPKVDVYALTKGREDWYSKKSGSDGIHPNKAGYTAIARAFADALLKLAEDPALVEAKLPAPGRVRTEPTPLTVSPDVAAIQKAVDEAVPGDVIKVKGGTCPVGATPIRIFCKSKLTLAAEGTTFAHDVTTTGRVLEVVGSTDIVIRGFKVTGGRVCTHRNEKVHPELKADWCMLAAGGGFLLMGDRITVKDCSFADCAVDNAIPWCDAGGGAIAAVGRGIVIEDCSVENCTSVSRATSWSYGGGGGLFIKGANASATNVVRGCTVKGCRQESKVQLLVYGSGGGIWNAPPYGRPGGTLVVENCTATGNAVSYPRAKERPYVGDGADVAGYRLVLRNVKTASDGPESVLPIPDPPQSEKKK